MKKTLVLFLLMVSTLSYGQKKWDVSVGPSLFAPVAKTIDWDRKAWGQRVNVAKVAKHEHFYYVLTLGLQQSKDRELQIPVIPSVRYKMYKNFHIGFGMGTTFSNKDKGRFTLAPSISYNKKRWIIEQSLFRTTVIDRYTSAGSHQNNVGLSVMYTL